MGSHPSESTSIPDLAACVPTAVATCQFNEALESAGLCALPAWFVCTSPVATQTCTVASLPAAPSALISTTPHNKPKPRKEKA